jgi:RimJ/RimL family protein N-acetyltransferase
VPSDSPPLEVPEIVAGDYQLRPVEPADAADLLMLLSEPSIRESFSGPAPTTEGQVREWIERRLQRAADGTGLSWTVRTAVGGLLAGTVECHDLAQQDSTAEIGYSTATAFRRRGVATSAVNAITGYLHQALAIHRLEITHEPANVASCRVATRCGYRAEGTLRGAARTPSGYIDLHLHSHLASDS